MDLASVGSMIASKASEAALSKLIDRLLELHWPSKHLGAKDILTQLSFPLVRNRYAKKYIARHVTMRTLASVDQDVLLDDIYVPIRLRMWNGYNSYNNYIVDDNFWFSYAQPVNIIGIAGQGKTTILRKLFVIAFKKSNYFPFYIELRKLEKLTIIDWLRISLENVGISIDGSNLDNFLSSGRVNLFLDGFDEIKDEFRQTVIEQIHSLHSKYEIPIIVTSRPNTEICREPTIINCTVQPLNRTESNMMLNVLHGVRSDHWRHSFLDDHEITDLLDTPILVNLYFICSLDENIVINSVYDFYDRLFLTLFRNHDIQKGVKRDRSSKFNVITISNIFEFFCYLSLSTEQLDFTFQKIISILENCLDSLDLDKTLAESVLSDIIIFTSLVQENGYDSYVFVHKTIPEYFCAKYYSKLSYTEKQSKYQHLIEAVDLDDRFDNMMVHLANIDGSSFYDNFIKEYFFKYGIYENMKNCEFNEIAMKLISIGKITVFFDKHNHTNLTLSKNPLIGPFFRTVSLLTGSGNVSSTLYKFKDHRISYYSMAQLAAYNFLSNEEVFSLTHFEVDQAYDICLISYLKEACIYDQVISEVAEYLHDVYDKVFIKSTWKVNPIISDKNINRRGFY